MKDKVKEMRKLVPEEHYKKKSNDKVNKGDGKTEHKG
jgi:hypothetical protein